jgi:alpha-D-ribose 1-methylphosphonate 5-triphosphate synthase subunit PhnG
MAVLARAPAREIEPLLPPGFLDADWTWLRPAECGLVMLRGRAGGAGRAFNLGEMTVTRATVRAESGAIGHATVIGRDRRHASLAAMLDATLQDRTRAETLLRDIVAPLAERQAQARAANAGRAAATQVQFFTMATMRS